MAILPAAMWGKPGKQEPACVPSGSRSAAVMQLCTVCTSTTRSTIEYLVDLVVDVQTVHSCITAAERDPEGTQAGSCFPGLPHIAAGSIAMLKARQRITEILRILPGSSLVVAPADTDLADPRMAAGLEESFGGGGYTALQRSALLHL